MKDIFKQNFAFIILTLLVVGFSAFKEDIKAIYQPVVHDTSLVGVGDSPNDPLAVNHPTLFAAIITQASTSAPTAYEIENLIDDDAFTWTRDSIGTYKVEGSDEAFPDSTLTWTATLGNAAADIIKFYRQSDSTGILRCENAAGLGADLVGKAYVVIGGDVPD